MSTDLLFQYLKRYLSDDEFAALIQAGVSLVGLQGLRRWVAERDVEAFARLYFPSEFYLELAPIHRTFVADIEEVQRRQEARQPGLKLARAIPRGHSKTSWYARIMPLHALLYGWSELTVLLGNTQTSAERLLKNIRDCLEDTPGIVEDFGSQRGDVWQSDHIQAANGCSIRAFGVGSGSLRGVSKPGSRPSLIIGDDLDDDASVRSATQLESNIDWLTKGVMSLGDQVAFTTSFVFLGTLIRKSSLLAHVLASPDFKSIVEQGVVRFSDNPGLWDEWREWYIEQAKTGIAPSDPEADTFYMAHQEAMLAGTHVLWDRPHAFYHLMLFRLSRGDAAFSSEIQNAPDASTQLLGAIPYCTPPDDPSEWMLLASLDPTTKGGSKNDKAAWIEILFHKPRKEVVVSFCNAEQRPAAETISYVMGRLKRSMQPGNKRYDGLWAEANSAGTLIIDSLEERTANQGLFYSFNRVNNSAAKEDRIAVLAEYAARKQLFVANTIDEEFVREWEGFGSSWKFDDALDAAATIVLALKDAELLDLVPVPY